MFLFYARFFHIRNIKKLTVPVILPAVVKFSLQVIFTLLLPYSSK
jgi:hypothetical protein